MNPTTKERLIEKVESALDQVRPYLAVDGGNVEVVEITDDYLVRLKWLGSCQYCNMTAMTMRIGIEETIKNQVGVIQGVEAINNPK